MKCVQLFEASFHIAEE